MPRPRRHSTPSGPLALPLVLPCSQTLCQRRSDSNQGDGFGRTCPLHLGRGLNHRTEQTYPQGVQTTNQGAMNRTTSQRCAWCVVYERVCGARSCVCVRVCTCVCVRIINQSAAPSRFVPISRTPQVEPPSCLFTQVSLQQKDKDTPKIPLPAYYQGYVRGPVFR